MESKCSSVLKEMAQCKIELASAKSYINSLPTQQMFAKLEVCIILISYKPTNLILSNYLLSFDKEIVDRK